MMFKLIRVCVCGHTKEQHTGYSGPNSINEWSFGQCAYGAESLQGYRFGGCVCYKWRPMLIPRVKAS